MAKFTEIETELLNHLTDDRLRSSLEKIREVVEDIWATDAPRIIQDYTDHGIKHSERVIDYAAKLLNVNDGRDLSEQEMYLLLAGIYLHDIGMQCDIVKFPEIKERAEKLGAQFEVEFTAKTASEYSIEEQKAIRKNHQYLTAAWIDYANRTGTTILGPVAKGIQSELVDDLMDVCKHHAKLPINECPQTLKFDPTGRKQLVASLLRFSDELDVDNHRVSIETVKNFSLNPLNSVYWWLHNRTKVVFSARNVIILTLQLHPNDVKQHGSFVYTAFINEFHTKNRPVLSVLARDGIPIVISDDSKVVENNRVELLPVEIVQALHVMQERNPLIELADEVRTWLQAIRYEVNDLQQRDDRTLELVATLEQGTIKQRVLVRCIGGEITPKDVDLLDKVLDRKTPQGWLISDKRISNEARKRAAEDDAFHVFNLSEFLQQMVWGPYFDALKVLVEKNKIHDLYVDIGCYKQTMDKKGNEISREMHTSIDEYIDDWLIERGKMHISLLGDFGGGKTWFCRHYAYRQLDRYLKDPIKERLPILITLRSFAKAMTAQQLINDALLEQYKLQFVGSAFEIFREMNRRGKLLLILDGFDEMAQQVDYQTVVDNFLELAKLVDENSKVLLTSRTEYFRLAKESEKILGGKEFEGDTIVLSPPEFEVLHIEPFSNEQIRKVIILRKGDIEGPVVAERILNTKNLAEMARKPVLVELLLGALDEVSDDTLENPSKIYLYATNKLLLRNIETKRTFTTTADKLYFLCELAWEMINNNEFRIHYTEIPERIKDYFDEKIKGKHKLDNWDFDLRNQTMLHRDASGYYEFAHKSLSEYFVAFKFAAELGCLAPDFMKTYCEAESKSCKIPIDKKNITGLVETFGEIVLTDGRMFAILKFLSEMMTKDAAEQLWEVVNKTKGKTLEEVRYTGGNAIILLLINGESFIGAKLEKCVLAGANMGGIDLTGANLRGTNLNEVNFSSSKLEGVDMSNADLHNTKFNDFQLGSMQLSPDDRHIAIGLSDGTIFIKDIIKEELVSVLSVPYDIYMKNTNSLAWSPNGLLLAASYWNGFVRVWQPFSKDVVKEIHYGSHVGGVSFSPDGNYLGVSTRDGIFIYDVDEDRLLHTFDVNSCWSTGCFSTDSRFFLCGIHNRSIKMWSLETGLEVEPLWRGRARKGVFWKVVLSGNGAFLVAGGSNGFELWNISSGKRVFGQIKKRIHGVCFSQSNQYLAVSDEDGLVKVWKVEGNNWISTPICTLDGHCGPVRSVAFSHNSKTLISASQYSDIRIWDIDSNSSNFGHCIKLTKIRMNCNGMKISSAHELEQKMKLNKGENSCTLLEFLADRGAILDKKQKQTLAEKRGQQ